MPVTNVNDKETIKKSKQKYYHCFKLNESNYALFDIKMDMPVVIGSSSIIQSTKLPANSFVFNYELNSRGIFEKYPLIHCHLSFHFIP